MAANYPFQMGTLDSLHRAKEVLERAIGEYEKCEGRFDLSLLEGPLFATLDNLATVRDEVLNAVVVATCQTVEFPPPSDLSKMQVGVRVQFVGPAYDLGSGPRLGQEGTVTVRLGHRSQRVGHEEKELITVRFDGDNRDMAVAFDRLSVIG